MLGGFGNSGFDSGFDSFFTTFRMIGIFQMVMFIFVFGIIGFTLFKGISQWN